MSSPKEPNFFSDDKNYHRGTEWYESLFATHERTLLCGESSTHYTKRPTYPHTVERIRKHAPGVRFIYLMRHPIERLVSHYIHDWTERLVSGPIDDAVLQRPELIAYGRYAMQLEPYLNTFGADRVLPVFLERLHQSPQDEFDRIGRFIGYPGRMEWHQALEAGNVSSQRLRKNQWRDALVSAPGLRALRQKFIPRSWRARVRQLWTMTDRPRLSPSTEFQLIDIFDDDLAILGNWLGTFLSCRNFKSVATVREPMWTNVPQVTARS